MMPSLASPKKAPETLPATAESSGAPQRAETAAASVARQKYKTVVLRRDTAEKKIVNTRWLILFLLFLLILSEVGYVIYTLASR
jgi:hypothetical protein